MHSILRQLSLVCALGAALAGCTSMQPKLADAPIPGYDLVDPAKVDKEKYAADYAACVGLANQDQADVNKFASNVVGVAADKATFGLIGSKSSKDADRNAVLKKCLSGRGYTVLR